MSSEYDDKEFEDGDEFVQSDPSRRLAAARGELDRALRGAEQAALKTSRYLPWLFGAALVAMFVAIAAIAYGVVVSFSQAPPTPS
jgi:hypothetical protein